MSTIAVSQPMLFPWRGMFEQIRLADTYVIYDDVQFSRGAFTNRVQVKTQTGPMWMTVPVVRGPLGQLISDIRIDDRQPWRKRHRRTFEHSYAGAPFLDDALELMDATYSSPTPMLADLLIAGLHNVCRYLGRGFEAPMLRSSDLDVDGSATERVVAIVSQLGATRYVTGHGARNYLDHEAFEAAGIRVEYMTYSHRSHPQFHGQFTPYVSILDVIAHVGGDAAGYVEPRTVYWADFLAESADDRVQRK